MKATSIADVQLMLAKMRIHFFRVCRWRMAASCAAVGSALLYAQAPAPAPKADPDVLIFADGEKLIGKLESAKGGSLTFKSDMAGEVTVDWSKVQELRTSQPFAVITKNAKIVKHADVSQVPEGKLSMTDQKIELDSAGGAPRTIPVADLAFVVAQPDFEKAVSHEEGFLEDWGGAVTAGLSLVESTQESRTFTGAITLVRAEPTASWLNPSSRTLVDLSGSYGTLSQPGTAEIKTDILHGDAERDQYFAPRLFGFARVAFDHNFSQDLDLQQSYGGGLGWTVIKTSTAEFDLKVAMDYIRQTFAISASNQSLVGSTFGEIYTRKFTHGIVFNEQISATPAWNNTAAYSATGTASLALPVHKRFSLAITSLDTFLNDPPPGFKKNSFQFTTGLAYALR
jgi:hypothetical protein